MATSDRAARVAVLAEAPAPAGASAAMLAACVRRAWAAFDGPPGAAVDVVLLGEDEHTRLHERWMGDSTPTDVMAVAYRDPDLWGEIFVNVECAQRVARERGHAAARECALYVTHGALHLLGFDDLSPRAAAAMRAAEQPIAGARGGA
jgi:probable rRNA maturation factor